MVLQVRLVHSLHLLLFFFDCANQPLQKNVVRQYFPFNQHLFLLYFSSYKFFVVVVVFMTVLNGPIFPLLHSHYCWVYTLKFLYSLNINLTLSAI